MNYPVTGFFMHVLVLHLRILEKRDVLGRFEISLYTHLRRRGGEGPFFKINDNCRILQLLLTLSINKRKQCLNCFSFMIYLLFFTYS